ASGMVDAGHLGLSENAMIARPGLSITLRDILDRVGLVSPHRRTWLTRRLFFNHWQRMFAALADWSAVSNLSRSNEILVRDRPERFFHFCRVCGEDTPHEGLDEFGAGWYAQICCCRYCGGQCIRGW